MVSLNQFSPVCLCVYNWSFTFKSSVVMKLAKAKFENEEWAAFSVNGATKGGIERGIK